MAASRHASPPTVQTATLPPLPPTLQWRALVQVDSDQRRLTALQAEWLAGTSADKAELVRQAAKQLHLECNTYTKSAGPISYHVYTALRNLLSLVSLLARRDFVEAEAAPAADSGPVRGTAKGLAALPLEVFPGCAESLLVLLEAPERVVDPALPALSGQLSFPQPDAAGPVVNALKFHALHAFNRLLESFPLVMGVFVPLLTEGVVREMKEPKSMSSPAYLSKLCETFGLVVATHPAALAPSADDHTRLAFDLLMRSTDGIDAYVRPQTGAGPSGSSASAAPTSKAPAPVPAALSSEHRLSLDLIDLLGSLLRKLHLRLPRAYPSSRFLLPRSWPFGSDDDETAEPREGRAADDDDDDEDETGGTGDDDEDEEDEAAHHSGAAVAAPRAKRTCFTEPISPVPLRKGVKAVDFGSAGDVLASLLQRLSTFYTKVCVEGDGSSEVAGIVNDSGSTVLAFLPLLVALSNQLLAQARERADGDAAAHAEQHGKLVENAGIFIVECLREVDLSTFTPALGASCQQYLTCLAGIFKHAQRDTCLEFVHITYSDLVNWLGDAQQSFPRPAFIKLRRFAVQAFLALLYTLDTSFQSSIGSADFFADLFPLLANPLLTSHLLWLLRREPQHAAAKVLPLVMRGLLNTNTKQSPSVKTVQMILLSLGNVACFTRAFDAPAAPRAGAAVLPYLTAYIAPLLETVLATMERAPSGTGQTAALVLCRIAMASYDMPEVSPFLPRILSSYLRILDESLFVAEAAAQGDDYDEDDQDLVSQLQYCVLDMLHALMQDQGGEGAAALRQDEPADRPHPFDQAAFLRKLDADPATLPILRMLVQLLLTNSLKPSFFDDDTALRNSEIHLLKEMLAHDHLFRALLINRVAAEPQPAGIAASGDAPLSLSSLVITLLRAIRLSNDDNQPDRLFNYQLCLANLASVPAFADAAADLKAALNAPEHKQLLKDAMRDAATWKIVQVWTK